MSSHNKQAKTNIVDIEKELIDFHHFVYVGKIGSITQAHKLNLYYFNFYF